MAENPFCVRINVEASMVPPISKYKIDYSSVQGSVYICQNFFNKLDASVMHTCGDTLDVKA
jgi:hypothetical protein